MSEESTRLEALLVQPELRWQNPAENRQHLGSLIENAYAGRGDAPEDLARLVVLPETFTTSFLGDQGRAPESMDGETMAWMKRLASRYRAAVCGSVVIGEGGERANRFLFVTPDGQVSHYDKRHLFAFQGEDRRYTAGRERVVVTYRGWRICPQICYDLRFPVWCRNVGDYDLLLFVANWPEIRANAWRILLRARAIENQACVIGVNRVGVDGNGLRFLGDTLAFDGLGEELANLGDREGTQTVVLDLDKLRKLRAELPFLADADEFEIRPPQD